MVIKEEMLSSYQQELADKLDVKFGAGKLCLTLKDKEKYILHYRNLKQYLDLGLKLKKVHRVLKFKQSQWLKSYIDLNTGLRREANSKFEENFAKLMNNSFFGKTCEDVRRYIDVKIITDDEVIEKTMKKEKCSRWKIYGKKLLAVQMERSIVVLDKPRYIGMTILGLSKLVMYDFHYNFIMEKYPGTELLFTDTDSFCYLIPTEKDIYKGIKMNE